MLHEDGVFPFSHGKPPVARLLLQVGGLVALLIMRGPPPLLGLRGVPVPPRAPCRPGVGGRGRCGRGRRSLQRDEFSAGSVSLVTELLQLGLPLLPSRLAPSRLGRGRWGCFRRRGPCRLSCGGGGGSVTSMSPPPAACMASSLVVGETPNARSCWAHWLRDCRRLANKSASGMWGGMSCMAWRMTSPSRSIASWWWLTLLDACSWVGSRLWCQGCGGGPGGICSAAPGSGLRGSDGAPAWWA